METAHQDLCDLEQKFFLDAIRDNLDLSQYLEDAVTSLQVALACDRSVREWWMVNLNTSMRHR